MADILDFKAKKPDRLGRAAATAKPNMLEQGEVERLLCGGCANMAFIVEWPEGRLICTYCGSISGNFQAVELVT
jgi:ribosomal protein S27E